MNNNNRYRFSTAVIARFLKKFAKHLVLLACLLILGRATGRVDQGDVTIFLIVAGAVLLDCIGNHLKRRRLTDFNL